MSKLTRRYNGKQFISGYKRDALISKLGPIEEQAEGLADRICDDLCRHRDELDESELWETCEACPVTQLLNMIE